MKITVTQNMLAELIMSEVEPFRSDHGERKEHVAMAFCRDCGGRPNLEQEAMICAIEKANPRSKRPVITVTEFQVPGWVWALYYDIDKWGDWGREGTPYIRAGRRIMQELEAEYPETFTKAYNTLIARSAAWRGLPSHSLRLPYIPQEA